MFKNSTYQKNKGISGNISLFADTSGFVYGAMGFVDRSLVGITIMVIQNYCPPIPKESVLQIDYFRWVLVFVNGGLIFVAVTLAVVLLLHKTNK